MRPEAAPTPSPAPAGDTDEPETIDRLILPSLRQRSRDSLIFLAVAQTIYAVTLLFSQGLHYETRAAINVIRLVVLYWCVWALRGEGSRRETLLIQGIGLGAQFACGVVISVVRQDVFPMVLLVIVLTSITSVFVPWGARVQGLLSLASGFSLFVATTLVHRATGQSLGFDVTATIVVSLIVTTFIAHFLDQSRSKLKERLEEARRTDEELASLRDQLERRVAERTAELEMTNRELEGFSYMVSHDLRSPLRSIAGFSQVVLDESGERLDESARASLAKIREASRRMDGLIDDMLLLARVGRSALRYETVDLGAIAESIGEDLAADSPHRRLEFRVGSIPHVRGDHGLLRIALDNLLRNAWKFTGTRETAHVEVSGEKIGGNIVVRVKDDGIGFDPRFRGKLFHPFERIHSDPRFPGTGVGLATVARIMRRHGGDVDATGALDEGATFSIIIPEARPR
ncbi:MAG: ATP-binding protein [Candidatus Binatia bacterium]